MLRPLLNALQQEATLVTVGHPGEPAAIDLAKYVNNQGITARGIFGPLLWDTWEQLLLQSGRIEVDWLVTHRLPLDDAEDAVDLLTGDAGKVLLIPRTDGR